MRGGNNGRPRPLQWRTRGSGSRGGSGGLGCGGSCRCLRGGGGCSGCSLRGCGGGCSCLGSRGRSLGGGGGRLSCDGGSSGLGCHWLRGRGRGDWVHRDDGHRYAQASSSTPHHTTYARVEGERRQDWGTRDHPRTLLFALWTTTDAKRKLIDTPTQTRHPRHSTLRAHTGPLVHTQATLRAALTLCRRGGGRWGGLGSGCRDGGSGWRRRGRLGRRPAARGLGGSGGGGGGGGGLGGSRGRGLGWGVATEVAASSQMVSQLSQKSAHDGSGNRGEGGGKRGGVLASGGACEEAEAGAATGYASHAMQQAVACGTAGSPAGPHPKDTRSTQGG